MATYVYDDFRVMFSPRDDGSFDMRATDAAGNVATGTFTVPLSEDDLQQAVLQVARSNSRKAAPATPPPSPAPPSGSATRDVGGAGPPTIDAARLGALLADALLQGDVGTAYDRAKQEGTGRGVGLRLSLSLESAPALVNIPWEFLYKRPRFLASQRHTPLVRWLDTGSLAPPPAIESTVRILGVISSPEDLGSLDVAAERRRVEDAVKEMKDLGRVELDWLEPATPRRLREVLRDGSYQILHYVGHSDYSSAGDGMLFLENDEQKSVAVDSTLLANLLSDQTGLRLVVLNSCEGARTSLTDPYAGVATTLIQLGVPAVVAMQFEISDEAAIVFAEELYTNLIGRQDPIDAAVAEARKAILIEVDEVEWATPVLFVRDPKVELFSFVVPAAPLPPPRPPEAFVTPIPVPTTTGDGDDGAAGEADDSDVEGPSGPGDSAGGSNGAQPRKSRWAVMAVVAATVAVAAVVIGVVTRNGDDDANNGATTLVDASVQTGVPSGGPRPHRGLLAIQVARPSGETHLQLVDPQTGAVSEATDNPDAVDTDPDWDPTTNHLAFVREDPSPAACVGICDVVPSGGADGDEGRKVAQLIPEREGRRHHSPTWARDGALYYAVEESPCDGNACESEIHRATFTAGPDGTGFDDVFSAAGDELVFGGALDLRDLDADPQADLRIALAQEAGVFLVNDGLVERLLPESADARAVSYAFDGNAIAAILDDGVLRVWTRDGIVVGATDIGELLFDFVEEGGDVGDLDPADTVALSVSPGTRDTSFLVLAGDTGRRRQPRLAIIGPGAQGNPIIAELTALPLDVTSRGELQAIAI